MKKEVALFGLFFLVSLSSLLFVQAQVADLNLTSGQLGNLGSWQTWLPFIMAAIFFFTILAIALYVYTSFAFMTIAKKVKYKTPELAWIPVVGPALIASKTAKMDWWPVLLLLGGFIPFIGGLCQMAYLVFFIIWMWKTFEALKRPGWWAILFIIPVVNLVLLGIAAWSKK